MSESRDFFDNVIKQIVRNYARAVSYADLVNRLVEGELSGASRYGCILRHNSVYYETIEHDIIDFLYMIGSVLLMLYPIFLLLFGFFH